MKQSFKHIILPIKTWQKVHTREEITCDAVVQRNLKRLEKTLSGEKDVVEDDFHIAVGGSTIDKGISKMNVLLLHSSYLQNDTSKLDHSRSSSLKN